MNAVIHVIHKENRIIRKVRESAFIRVREHVISQQSFEDCLSSGLLRRVVW
jgi:hypothetical protein